MLLTSPRKSFRLAAALLCAVSAWAQASSSIRGTVTDPQGAAVANAKLILSNAAIGFSRAGVSDSSGLYQFLQVPPGKYTVKVELPGFASLVRSDVLLQVNLPATLDLRLELGNVTETVNVTGDSVVINTTDASVGNNFTEAQVRQLPLLTRNVVELLSLQPGVTDTGEVLGARKDQNNVTLDGVDVNDNQTSVIVQSPANRGFKSVLPVPLDSVQEFRVTVGGQGAAQGRSSGGQVSLVTKSGSNAYHGSLYEFHRNTKTAANSWFNNRSGVAREALIRNQFGGSIGGKIIKDRLFFFFNYEQRIDASGAGQTRTVPSESLKQGILRYNLSNGATGQLTPAEIRSVDPRGIGISAATIALFNSYPAGNDPSLGSDRGLNFSGLRFNAPFKLDYKAYVAKMDYNVDKNGNHKLSWRGTLADNKEDLVLAQFPGQAPASTLLDNSRGFVASYSAVLRPTLINSFNAGFTRQGLEQSGSTDIALAFGGISDRSNFTRGNGRRLPVWNLTDDLTWTKGTHTITAGTNIRFVKNDRFSYAPSFASYSMGRGTMLGLGSDMVNGINAFIRQRDGNSALALANTVPTVNAMGGLLGMLTSLGVTYQFDRSGKALSQGVPQSRNFKTNEYEFYVGDSWRMRKDLTLTYGVRYANYGVPYEANGLQVNTTVGLDTFFAERVGGQALGIPSNKLPNANLTYALAGPANNAKGWWARDNNNFAPRFSFAYNPTPKDGMFSKLFGKNSVIRGGAGMVYDRFGSDLITNFDQLGSVGLASRGGFPESYNMTTAPRFTGAFPAVPTAPSGGFPNTPAPVVAVAGTGLGMMSDLRTPYSVLLNLNYARELPGNQTLEIGYVGRLSRKLLLQGDVDTPLTNFKDPKSGQTWKQMAGTTRALSDGGLSAAAVEKTPSLVPTLPFAENQFPGLKDFYFPGSASANYFYHVYGENDGSDLDGLHLLDRVRSFNDGVNCMSVSGCHSFFAVQGSALPTWMNAGMANFHGMTLSVRKRFSKGFSYDFNYTWSHSIDNGSAAEAGAGQFGGILQSIYAPGANRGASDFDIRHNLNANGVFELPFGKGKKFLSSVPSAVNQFIGGWQVSAIVRYRTGLPAVIGGNGLWNTNYWFSSRAIATGTYTNAIGYNQNGNPSIFPSTTAAKSFTDQYPGEVGGRELVRLDDQINWDMSLAKSFSMPWEGHRLQFRAEAFNAFNNVNFFNASLALTSPATFGELQSASAPRVFQFGLRYEF